MIIKRLMVIFLFVTSLVSSEVKIALSSNVNFAMKKLIEEFNKTFPDIKVNVTLGSSGKLTAQINKGAPYELFMSADMKYPNALYKANMTITKPLVYAQGRLAFFSYKKRDFSSGINLLKSEKIKKIAIANPRTAPYGKASVEAMNNAKIYEKVKDKLVFAESISHAISYAVTATDLGIVAKSSLLGQKMAKFKKGINWTEVNPKLYTPINQGIVILKKGENNKEIKVFYNFIFSEKARKIFQDFGYSLP